ncbi:hypothetical protein RHAB21_03073 [Pseudorhizobium halotolerans]|uniref:Uncharacterized protein n=1 Tax=Pseudorhizobium halotolerans TaxID=1233081 RepID=A0ABM8PPB6_9HYPH|nr:hypothetical protein RHAB21_03073 [Pseudorhizobium halotolerans]
MDVGVRAAALFDIERQLAVLLHDLRLAVEKALRRDDGRQGLRLHRDGFNTPGQHRPTSRARGDPCLVGDVHPRLDGLPGLLVGRVLNLLVRFLDKPFLGECRGNAGKEDGREDEKVTYQGRHVEIPHSPTPQHRLIKKSFN